VLVDDGDHHDGRVFGIVVNKHAQRFYDEGEDIWQNAMRLGPAGRGAARQIAYIIFDSTVVTSLCRRCFAIGALSIAELAGQLELDRSIGKDRHRFQSPQCSPARSITPSSTYCAPKA